MDALFPTNNSPNSFDTITKQWIPMNFPIDKPFPVKITTIVSPSNFWLQLKGPLYDEELERLEVQMNLFYHHLHQGEYFYNDGAPFDRFVAINFNGAMRRVIILRLEIQDNSVIAICFHCDYGLITRIESQNMMKLHPSFAYLPQQAIWSTLSNVEPTDRILPWKPDVCASFAYMIKDKVIEAELCGAHVQRYKLHLKLHDVTNRQHILDINNTLIDLGHANLGATVSVETEF